MKEAYICPETRVYHVNLENNMLTTSASDIKTNDTKGDGIQLTKEESFLWSEDED